VVDLLSKALEADYVVMGGGNARLLDEPPEGVSIGNNENAFSGGFRLWQVSSLSVKSIQNTYESTGDRTCKSE
jgi:hypothetical protein